MKGEAVVVAFPFSDLSQAKNRPALVLIDLPGTDAVLAAITSTRSDPHAIALEPEDFQQGALSHLSYIHRLARQPAIVGERDAVSSAKRA